MAGAAQLVYELHVTNFSADAVTIVAARVLDENARSLLDLSNTLLEQRIGRLDAHNADAGQQRILAAGMRWVTPSATISLWISAVDATLSANT